MISEDKRSITDRFLAHCHRKRYPSKSSILSEGELGTDLFYVIDGSISVLTENEEGREILLAYLNPGDYFGEMSMFFPDHKRSAFVRTRTECEIARISHQRLKELDGIFPELLFQIATQLAHRLMKINRRFSDLAFTDVQGRVARTLLDLCKEPNAVTHPDGMQIKITRRELSRFVGCSREMVGRALKSLEESNLIEVSGKTIVVFGAR